MICMHHTKPCYKSKHYSLTTPVWTQMTKSTLVQRKVLLNPRNRLVWQPDELLFDFESNMSNWMLTEMISDRFDETYGINQAG